MKTRKTWKVVMITRNGKEVTLYSFKDKATAERKATLEARHDAYDESIGYGKTGTQYVARYC